MAVPDLDEIIDRLERADEHFETIKEHLCAYYRTSTVGVRGYFDPKRDGLVIGPGYRAPELRLHTLVGEFLHDLRSSLDHLVWLLVLLNHGRPTERTTFPILRADPTPNAQGVQAPPRVAGGVSRTASAVIEDAQPYKWQANYMRHPLYLLHELWNVDKHRHIVAKGSRLDELTIPDRTPRFDFTLGFDAVTEDGAEISLVPSDPAVKVNPQTTLQVMIDEPNKGIVEYPLSQALKEMRLATRSVVMQVDERVIEPMRQTVRTQLELRPSIDP
jgi:hypothetical protein